MVQPQSILVAGVQAVRDWHPQYFLGFTFFFLCFTPNIIIIIVIFSHPTLFSFAILCTIADWARDADTRWTRVDEHV